MTELTHTTLVKLYMFVLAGLNDAENDFIQQNTFVLVRIRRFMPGIAKEEVVLGGHQEGLRGVLEGHQVVLAGH